MKSHYIIILAVLTFLSCNDKVSEELDLQNNQILFQDNFYTYDMYFDSEITPYDGATRATTASDWVDGDVVYLRLMGNNHVYGKAEYISSSKKWKVTCDKPLANDTDANCCVWCGNGINPGYDEANKVYYDYMTEAYLTESGKYTFSNNSIYVNASMQPVGCRLRFKGQVGTFIQVNKTTGIDVYNVMSHTSNYGFSNWSYDFELKVGSNGYTDYFIAKVSSECTSISIKNKTTGESFIHDFNSNILKTGESGCFTIPTSSELHGWYATENGYVYVDLGLPSGTKWATCNVGASKPEDQGYFLAWGETEVKSWDEYIWSTYVHCDGTEETCHYIGDDIAGTEYDVAYVKWGGSWRMPNLDQIKELENKCHWELVPGKGSLITGPNGNSIFLPFSGMYFEGYQNHSYGYQGLYWSSNSTSNGTAFVLFSSRAPDDEYKYDWRPWGRPSGVPVRAVIPGDTSIDPDCPVAEPIDLGLPSGTKWASWNVGATKPEEYGGYYAWGETEEKDYYDWSTYSYCVGTQESCYHIGDDIAGTEYDVAHIKWGGSWCMPSTDQTQELVNNCTTTWTTLNGVNGTLFTGPNGASIFLPAAGNRWTYYLDLEGTLGDYWSSSLYPNYQQQYAYNLYCGLEGMFLVGCRYGRRCSGFTVRPVCP